ncbi:hypothetical protein L0244_26845, partial [bacterium]|nr:hypothetical protein [bacterium]
QHGWKKQGNEKRDQADQQRDDRRQLSANRDRQVFRNDLCQAFYELALQSAIFAFKSKKLWQDDFMAK